MMVKLGELTETIMGQAPPGKDCNKDGIGTVFVKAGEFGFRKPIVREWTTNPLKYAKDGDVLICVVGATAGKINLGIDCAIGRSVAAIRPNTEKLDTNYLHYFMRQETLKMRQRSQGLAQSVITKSMLAELTIPLIELAEQKRVGTILDKAALIRAKHLKAAEKANEIGEALSQKAFRGEL